jgi:RHS repeat-associated protein
MPHYTFNNQGNNGKTYAFGSAVKERTTSFTQKYRFGFNNQEQEIELGEYYSFEYRVHDARLGRFLSVDPLSDEYPWNSVYAFAENRVIDGRDLEGSEWQPVGKDGNNLPIGDKGITGYKWAGYERQTGFTNANNGTQAETWVAKEGTLANPPPIKMGNYTYQWSSDPNSRSGNVYMKWNGGTKNPSRPLDGKNIELKLQQQDNGTTTAHYRSGPSAPAYGFTPTAKNEWKPLNAVNKICVIPNGSYIKTDGKVDVTGMRASQMAIRANLQESGSLAGSQEPDVVKTKYRSEALGDPLEPIYPLLVPEVGVFELGVVGLKVTTATKVVGNPSGWVKRSVFNSLDPAIQKKVAAAIEKGVVAPTGKQGIIKLTASEAAETGYQYKIKILGKGGDTRIYGNPMKNGHIMFDKIMGH